MNRSPFTRISIAALVAGTAIIAGSLSTSYAQTYKFVTFDDPNATNGTVDVPLINNSNLVLNCYFDSVGGAHYCVFDVVTGKYTELNDPNATGTTFATGINNNGKVVGYYSTPLLSQVGFLYDIATGVYADLHFPGPPIDEVTGINDNGDIIGIGSSPINNGLPGFVYSFATSVYTPFQFPINLAEGPTAATQPLCINNTGYIAGTYVSGTSYSFVYNMASGAVTDIANPNGVADIAAFSVNNAGYVVGEYVDAVGVRGTDSYSHGYIYDIANQTMQTIDDPNAAPDNQAYSWGVPGTLANSINNSGQIVGWYRDSSSNWHGFLYDVAAGSFTTIDSPDAASGNTANSINDNGWIAGHFLDANNKGHGFVAIPVPSIGDFFPASGADGAPVTITGSGFANASKVSFNGVATAFKVNSPTSITAKVPAGATTGPIRVTTLGGTQVAKSNFIVSQKPSITGFSPASGIAGTEVTISGTGFTGATGVEFGAGAATKFTVKSANSISAVVPANATSGVIRVTTPGNATSSTGIFKVAPTITGLNPASGPAGTRVTINGTAFSGATGVTFNNVPTTRYSVSQATIVAVVPVGATTGKVEVTTPGGIAKSVGTFTVIPTPVIAAFTPASAIVGTNIVITGTGLANASSVKFDGVAATKFTAGSEKEIVAAVPAGAKTGKISVTTPGGTVTSTNVFTVVPTPSLLSFTPASAAVGTNIVITGTGLAGASSVKFGGIAATKFTASGAGKEIVATLPKGARTGKISVATPGGTVTSTQIFTVK